MKRNAKPRVHRRAKPHQPADRPASFLPAPRLTIHRGGANCLCRVLIVDAEALIRGRLQDLLRAADFEVEVAATGEEALQVLHDSPCAMVLANRLIPDMDGLQLCRQIRGANRQDTTYVVMLGIRDAHSDRMAALGAGADACLTEGASTDELMASLETGRRIVRRRRDAELKGSGLGGSPALDRVTGAHGVARLVTHLPCELSRARLYGHVLAVLYCSIDDSPALVKTFGRAAAEAERREFVARSRGVLRRDDWIARVGLDDFVIILPETSNAGAHVVAPKLRALFRPHDCSTAMDPIGCTVNIAVTTVDPNYIAGSPAQIAALLRDSKRGVFLDAAADLPSTRRGNAGGHAHALH